MNFNRTVQEPIPNFNTPPETMRIKVEPCEGNEEGIVVINKSDFDPDLHTPADEEPTRGATINYSTMANAKMVELLKAADVDLPADCDPEKLAAGEKLNRGKLIELCKEHLK